MAVVWRLGLILFGFAAATLVAALSSAPEARAQDYASDPRTRSQPWEAPYLRKTEPRESEDAYESPSRETGARDTLDDGEIDPADGDITADEASPDDPDAVAAPEGEPEQPADGPATRDGFADLSDPRPHDDGADPLRDTRPAADTAPFTEPPAGYDPLLFQIEDIDPVTTDRRPARLFRFEPYDPVGIRIGSFVLFPETEIGGRWTSNALSSPSPRSDVAAEIRSTTRLVSNWSTHAIELKGTTFSTFYDEFDSEDDRAWDVEARGRIDITRRTNIQGLVGRSVSQESRSAVDANRIGERPDVTNERADLAFNHRFNRLSFQLRGSVSDTTYSASDGASNRDRDTLETREAVRVGYEFKPTLAVFAEQELNQREKETPPPDGIPRDSEGTRTRVGLDFGATGAILRGTISAGYGRQSPDDRRIKDVDAFLFDANLAWRVSELTSFLFTAETDIYETTATGSGGVVSHRLGIEARHAFRRHIIASAGLVYTDNDYDALPVEEQEVLAFIGGEYYASPELVLFARYQHLSFASNEANSDYDSDEVRVGVRLRR